MKITKIELSKPICDDNCKECKYFKEEDNSFDHEFGIERVINYDCSYDFIKHNGYGDCFKVTDFIDTEGLDYAYMVDVIEIA